MLNVRQSLQDKLKARGLRLAVTLLVLSLVAVSAHATQPKKKAVAVHPTKKAHKVVVTLTASFDSNDLNRIFVGNQAGILKIYGTEPKTVLFQKDAPNTDMVGVDGTIWAPVAERHRQAIFGALHIGEQETTSLSVSLIRNFRVINQKNAVAMLGLIGSIPDPQRLPHDVSLNIRQFLSGLLTTEKDVVVRRQAVLALAICADTDEPTVKEVIAFMTHSHNAWETFTTRQFFEYHKDQIRSMASMVELREQVESSGNPYASDIAALLN